MNYDVEVPMSGNARATEKLIILRVDPSLGDRVTLCRLGDCATVISLGSGEREDPEHVEIEEQLA